LFYFSEQNYLKIGRIIDRRTRLCYNAFNSARAGLFFAAFLPPIPAGFSRPARPDTGAVMAGGEPGSGSQKQVHRQKSDI